MIGMLLAAVLAGQSPVDQMVQVCADAMESPSGKRYFSTEGDPNPWDEDYMTVLRRKEGALASEIYFSASAAGVDVAETKKICAGMIIQRLAGARAELASRKFVTTTR